MVAFTYSDSCYSDLHKDVYGSRPSIGHRAWWDDLSPKEKQAHWDMMCRELADKMEQDERNEAQAAHDFELTMQDLLNAGAQDRDMAIRWLHEAYDTQGDASYLEYHLGLKYGYLGLDN